MDDSGLRRSACSPNLALDSHVIAVERCISRIRDYGRAEVNADTSITATGARISPEFGHEANLVPISRKSPCGDRVGFQVVFVRVGGTPCSSADVHMQNAIVLLTAANDMKLRAVINEGDRYVGDKLAAYTGRAVTKDVSRAERRASARRHVN